jgi:hypothetical protein
MPQREFANQKALVAYAERNGLFGITLHHLR